MAQVKVYICPICEKQRANTKRCLWCGTDIVQALVEAPVVSQEEAEQARQYMEAHPIGQFNAAG